MPPANAMYYPSVPKFRSLGEWRQKNVREFRQKFRVLSSYAQKFLITRCRPPMPCINFSYKCIPTYRKMTTYRLDSGTVASSIRCRSWNTFQKICPRSNTREWQAHDFEFQLLCVFPSDAWCASAYIMRYLKNNRHMTSNFNCYLSFHPMYGRPRHTTWYQNSRARMRAGSCATPSHYDVIFYLLYNITICE